MACYSGGVVKEIEKRRSSWENYKKEGRTFFVMSSSPASQTSSTGTGNGEKPGAPMGSSGSAFGHALWKSLAGDADGYVDGVKDGFVDLGEIEAYTKFKTQQIGGHMPQVAGSYNPSLIMNKVVTSADKILLSNPDRGTDNLDDYAVAEMIRQEDAYWSTQVHSLPSWEDLGY